MNTVTEILKNDFKIDHTGISELWGYANKNYKVTTREGNFVLKQYSEEPNLNRLLEAENEILEMLSADFPGYYQKPIKALRGGYLVKVKGRENDLTYRLLRYIDGDLLAKTDHSEELLESFGALLGQMDSRLLKKRNPIIEARRYEWDILQIDLTKKYSKLIPNPADRKLVDYFSLQYNELVRSRVSELRHSIIHGDANNMNVLVKDNRVTGIIDFGDLVYSLLINELAIALSYIMFDKDDPVKWALPVIRGYCKILPLTTEETDLLYYLVAARLCIGLRKAAHAKQIHPDDAYLTISEKPSWRLLHQWITINPVKATSAFRKAANLPEDLPGSTAGDIEKRSLHLSKSLSLSYSIPIKMERAAFQYMYDTLGNTYLDARNNIPHVGHCHPMVVEAGQRTMARLNTNTRYLYDELNEYAERLLSKFSDSLVKVFFVNSGSAASDLAIRLALTHTKKTDLVVMEMGYHGNTGTGIDISHYKFSRKGGKGEPQHVITAPLPDTYRRRLIKKEGSTGEMYSGELISKLASREGKIAGFIAEPIIGGAGQISLPGGYLKEVYELIRKQGGVCISDEVQTGFGRLGTHFWGYEMFDVIPDIVVLGKPIGNGHPMAAVVCTKEIAGSFENGMEFFSSFGGNPVSCAIGMAVLDVMESEKLQENALKTGNYLISQLKQLQSKHACIGDIRGSGLFLGVEFVESPASKEPATRLTGVIQNELKERKILVDTEGPFENVLKIKPPLCFTQENADQLVTEIDAILTGQKKGFI